MALAIMAVLGPGLFNVFLALGFTHWSYSCRVTRSQVLAARSLDYVTAAQALGQGPARIMLQQILPNIVGPILVIATLGVAYAILNTEAAQFLRDSAEARDFYGRKLGFPDGRSAEHWVDFDMFGHQCVVHLNPALGRPGQVAQIMNPVDGHGVPVPHCGVVLTLPRWEAFAARLRGTIDRFVIEPYVRFKGLPGEQATMFFLDPSGNALEFKAFRDIEAELFRKD